jgi:hypothetical protein
MYHIKFPCESIYLLEIKLLVALQVNGHEAGWRHPEIKTVFIYFQGIIRSAFKNTKLDVLIRWRYLFPQLAGFSCEVGEAVQAVGVRYYTLSIDFYLETTEVMWARLNRKRSEYFVFISVCNKVIQLFTFNYVENYYLEI